MERTRVPISPTQLMCETWMNQPTAEITFKVLYAESVKYVGAGVKECHKFSIIDIDGKHIDHIKTTSNGGTTRQSLKRSEFVLLLHSLLNAPPYFQDNHPDLLNCSTKISSNYSFHKIDI